MRLPVSRFFMLRERTERALEDDARAGLATAAFVGWQLGQMLGGAHERYPTYAEYLKQLGLVAPDGR